MLYKFRICPDPDFPDTAQGWVVADSEMQARALVGEHATLQRMPSNPAPDLQNGTVLVTEGSLHGEEVGAKCFGKSGNLAIVRPALRVVG